MNKNVSGIRKVLNSAGSQGSTPFDFSEFHVINAMLGVPKEETKMNFEVKCRKKPIQNEAMIKLENLSREELLNQQQTNPMWTSK